MNTTRRIITLWIGVILIINGGRHLIQVNFAENETNYSSIEIEFDGVDGRSTDSEVGNYLANRRAAADYRDSERAGGCGVF